MSAPPLRLLSSLFLGACIFRVATTDLRAQIEPAKDAPQPRPPEESAKLFRLPPGFHIELVASEPHLADPTGIAFDARGRIFVSELYGYNLDGHYDVAELNETGVLDKQVRRIPANPRAIERAEKETHGRVKLLEDLDGDGRVDQCAVWADDLPAAYGVVAAREGAIVVCAPHIIFLADGDGDGRAEVRETLFTGFGVGEMWTRINTPRWGPDNWIYVEMGAGSGGTIRGPHLRDPVRIGNTAFRIRSDGSAIEPITGGSGGFGLTLTDFGDRFHINNSNHARYAVPLPHRYLARNPYAPSPGGIADASRYTRVFPTSQPHPWRLTRSKDPAWVRLYGAHEATANGNFTAVCGQLIYRAAAFPADYRGNHFSCESQQNLIHRSIVERDGAGFRVRRAPEEERSEFLTSTEGWFRPVNLELGPDGALYIVDMYREIIEDYSAIPRFLQQQYGLITGSDRGRIWRVVHEDAPQPTSANLVGLSSAQLVAELASGNAWRRETAQRLLVERRAKGVVPAVRELVRRGSSGPTRVLALYTLAGLDALAPDDVALALDDPHFGVRTHGLRLGDRWLDTRADLRRRAAELVDDEDAAVRLAAVLALGETRGERAFDALLRAAVRHGTERWMSPAILSAVGANSARFLRALLVESNDTTGRRALIEPLARVIGARHGETEIALLLEGLVSEPAAADLDAGARVLRGLLAGLRDVVPPRLDSPSGQSALLRLLGSTSANVRVAAFQLVRVLKLDGSPALDAAFEKAAGVAVSETRDLAERESALRILAGAPFEILSSHAAKLLDPRHPPELQLAAVAALATTDDTRVGELILDGWPGYSPRVQASVLDAILAKKSRLPALLDALESETVPPSSIGGIQRAQFLEALPADQRDRARSLLAPAATDEEREKLLASYLAVVKSREPDVTHGKAKFQEICATCHKVRGEGQEVGPDLSSARSRADETLLRDLLLPSDQITIGFRSYVVVTASGEVVTGTLASEGATSITIKTEGGEAVTVLRRDIQLLKASPISLMVENLPELLTPADAADVIGYLRSVFGDFDPAGFVLFDDERDFPSHLVQGGGTATICSADRFSGEVSLAVTPLQRYAERLPDWGYRIVEKPADGEFRYLRLAWKSRGGEGVMVELAADGGWPAPDKPGRRYYSGRNTTKWQAKRVSSDVPTEWTVVTVDLWEDCGSFTLTGIAPTAMGGTAFFDRIELLRVVGD